MDSVLSVAAALSPSVSLLIAYFGFIRNRRSDDKASGRQDGTLMSEIGYIKAGVDDIKSEQRQQRQWNEAMAERVAAAESSLKSAHHRIDRLEGLHDKEQL